ncbi:MAG: FkbM family methyltransferase [Chitinophagaceae bacterium]|jgi:FkbM family methyltransferase
MRIPSIKNILLKQSPYRKVGINWLKEKIIKHSDSKNLKSINACGKIINYTSNEELIHCLKEIFFDNIYKFETKKENPLIIDCGAHIGMSILSFKQQHPGSSIIAFEPDANNFKLLKQNIKEWGYESIQLFQNPVWNSNDEITFEASGAMGGKISSDLDKNQSSIKLKAIRLSELLVKEIDFLKIDIEGAEYEVISDCRNKLQFVNNLFVEYHSTFEDQNKLIEILKILNESGFEFYIKEANNVYPTPFTKKKINTPFDIQLNIFAFRNSK